MTINADTAVQPSLYAEDLVVGSVHYLGQYRLTEDEVIEFASQWDPQAFHTDVDFAADGYFGGVIASGIQTLAVFQRLAVVGAYRHWWVVAGRGIRDLRFLAPVRPDTLLTAEIEIEDVAFAREDRARITVGGRVFADGVPVLSLATDAWVHRRPAGDRPAGGLPA